MTPKVVSKCLELGCFGFDLKTVLKLGYFGGPRQGGALNASLIPDLTHPFPI